MTFFISMDFKTALNAQFTYKLQYFIRHESNIGDPTIRANRIMGPE